MKMVNPLKKIKMYKTEVKYDSETDEYFIEFSDDAMKEMGWNIGDSILWKDNGDGSFTLSKSLNDSLLNKSDHND